MGGAPDSWATMSRASDSHLAYASGQHDRWTACAAWVTVIDCQPLMSSRPGLEVCVATP